MLNSPESEPFVKNKVSEEIFMEVEFKVFDKLFCGDDKALTRWIVDEDNAERARKLIEKRLLEEGDNIDIDLIVSELRSEMCDAQSFH